jgi:acyl-CoA thioesterase-1
MTNFARHVGACCSVAALVAAASCSSAASPTTPSPVETPRPAAAAAGVVLVLGDSLAVSPSRAEAFPAVLQKRLDATARGWRIVNAGVSGDTTAGGLRRFDQAVAPDTRVLVIELGANDGLQGLAIETIESNLAAIIERAQARGIRVLLCGMETPPMNGWSYTLDYHRLFPRLAQRYAVPLVPFLLAGVALNPDFNGADEIHPNAAGAQRIADTVWPYLEPLLQQPVTAPVR